MRGSAIQLRRIGVLLRRGCTRLLASHELVRLGQALGDLRPIWASIEVVAPLSQSAISRSSFGELRMLAVISAVRRLRYHSAPAET
jgi:hypothetical protein